MSDSVPEYVDPDDEPTTKYVTETGANLCGACDGTGEGVVSWRPCSNCNGAGELGDDSWLEDAYEAYCERRAEAREERGL